MKRRSAGVIGAFGALLCLTAPSPASAQPPPHIAVQLDYVLGPRGDKLCPGRAHLKASLKADFGYDPVQDDAPWRLTVAVNPGPGHTIQATMELRDPGGNVTWKDHKKAINDDCLTLISGVALAVRIGIDRRVPPPSPKPAPAAPKLDPADSKPTPADSRPEPPPRPAAPPKPAPAPRTAPPPKPPRPRAASIEPESGPRLRTGLGASFALGAAPAPNLALSLQAGVRFPYVSFSLEGRGDLPVEEEMQSFSTWRMAGSIVPCAHVDILLGCLVGTVGRQVVFNERESVSDWYGGAGVRLGVEIPIVDPLAVRFSGDVVATIPSEGIVRVNGMDERWTSPPINATLSGGLIADF